MEFISLIILVLAPLFASLILSCPLFPDNEVKIRRFSKIFAGILFFYSLLFVIFFRPEVNDYQFIQSIEWIKPLGIDFSFGIDGLSLIMIVMSTFLVFLALIASKFNITHRHKFYYSMVFVLTSAILGIFTAKDLFLFFLFWELELIPMYFLISVWGTGRKNYSALKFVLYTFLGSIFMIVSIIALVVHNSNSLGILTFDMATLASVQKSGYSLFFELLTFLGFFLAFAVKLPIVPFHTWLPDAHVDAPTPISMLLAGILLKMGGYGLIRMNLQMFPLAFKLLAPFIILLGIINIIYGALISLAQNDLKRLVAYSSISHMGLVLVGLGALNVAGVSGAVFQMVAHGVISAGLFMIVGVIYLRTHTREMAQLGGLAEVAPRIFYFSLIIVLASLGLPLLIGFGAETLVLYGAFMTKIISFGLPIKLMVIISAFSIVLTASYMLWMIQKVFMGNMFEQWKKVHDITPHEVVVLLSLVIAIVFFGIYPTGLTSIFVPAVNSFLSHI